jgi:hypothetical protein
MDSIEEIETAIDRLQPEDYRRVVDWIRAREEANWDEQLDRESAAGKLDRLFAEVETETTSGNVLAWPPQPK